MPKKSEDMVVATIDDAIVRKSDVELLNGPFWLNDRLIGFYFEYLYQKKFDASNRICFISPEVSQFLKLAGAAEIPVSLEPLGLETKDVILMPVNNAMDPDEPGGTHWSLLIFSGQSLTFYHMDSSAGINDNDARLLADKLHDFLVTKTSNRFNLKFEDVSVMKQSNGYDCGVHVLGNAEAAARHFLLYGGPEGLNLTTDAAVKNKREELFKTILDLSDESQDR